MICPICVGSGKRLVDNVLIACTTCGGERELSLEVMKSIAAGDKDGMTVPEHRALILFPAIVRERAFQDRKYPGKKLDVAGFILCMELELAEAKHAAVKLGDTAALEEILQVVCVGIAAIEQHRLVEREECAEQRSGVIDAASLDNEGK